MIAFRRGLSPVAMTLLLAIGPAAADVAATQDRPPATAAGQTGRDQARLEQARHDYEEARKQEQREIRQRARQDGAAMRRGGDGDRTPAGADPQRVENVARARTEAAQRQTADVKKAERRLVEAQRAYQALLEKTKQRAKR
jgi:hypothetical protein